MSDRTEGIVPPETAVVRKRRRRRRIAALVVVVAVVAAGIWVASTLLKACGSLGSGVVEVDGECVGVTDGSYVFHAGLAEIEGKIAAENERVRAAGDGHVSVALLDPLVPTDASALPVSSVRSRLEGAYTALRRINTERVAGDPSPQVQLLLANQGSTDEQQDRVLSDLRELAGEKPNPLVAVIGLGVSTARTKGHAEQLSEFGIPMVGAVLTADDLEYDRIPGLIKTSPSNRHYVAALRDYLDGNGLDSAIMVRDSNSDAGFDLYTKSLEEQFEKQMADLIKYNTQQFAGKSGAADVPSLFDNVQANICSAAGDRGVAVLYAGREIDLVDLLGALEHRTCRETPLTILTAGLELGKVLRDVDLADANLTVLNAATVDTLGWDGGAPGTPDGYPDFRTAFSEERFRAADLDDGGAIMMHDALLTAARAIRLAAPNGSASAVTAALVRTQLLNINTQYVVPGAGGTLRFSKQPAGGGTGIPEGKPIPLLQYPHPQDADLPSLRVGRLCEVASGPALVRCG